MYKKALQDNGSIRKAAVSLNLTKSKFMVLYKKELGLCTGTTGCQNPCNPGRTRCEEHLKYAFKTQDKSRKSKYYKKWVIENKEYKTGYMRQYQRDNKERINAHHRKYDKTDKGRIVNSAKSAYRRAMKKAATPSWVDRDALKAIYSNRPEGYHVDHIIPLTNDLVCGLHVPWNLQYLSAFDNDSKGDQFDGTNDNNSWRS